VQVLIKVEREQPLGYKMASNTDSRALIDALLDRKAYPHPVGKIRMLETHISWVLLAGCYAYKIKKPVNLGFLDFSDLPKRLFYCQEEIRLNQRLAPQLYLDVIAIGGHPWQPLFGAEPPLEYAVRMRRFSNAKLLNNLITKNQLTREHIDSLAATIAHFHAGLSPASTDDGYGQPQAIAEQMRQNFQQIAKLSAAYAVADVNLEKLRIDTEQEFCACQPLFQQRLPAGFIRECHGDLHLGNIVLLDNVPTPFDGIEFDGQYRWIDTSNEIAFLVMDLQYRGRADLAYRFLNGYLEISGDYHGLALLRYYLSYRAMVRAKIAVIRFSENPSPSLAQQCGAYLKLAAVCLAKRRPALIITHGLPGCGKTTVSQYLVEERQLIRIRSDVERKRLCGLNPLQTSGSELESGIYHPQASEQTYRHLLELAGKLLNQGYPLIVDAAFLKRSQRCSFQQLARELEVPFLILSVQCEAGQLRQRIEQRIQLGQDASEADLAVLAYAQSSVEPLQSDELAATLVFSNNNGKPDNCENRNLLQFLEQFLS
jgi:aminoglycoside phosphotransferase family enzyme/predicted kinase